MAHHQNEQYIRQNSTKDTNIIVGVASHDKNIHDSKTLNVAISSGYHQPFSQIPSTGSH
jgi:D-ribose pyranose/furanose isomerase RbsD